MSLKVTLDEVMIKDVLTAPADMKTSEAVRLMEARHAGSIVIVSGGRPIGIFTERDMLYKVVIPKLDPECVPVGEVMTGKLVTLKRKNTLEDAYTAMLNGNFRHLVVMDTGKIVGIASMKDLIKFRGKILEQMVEEQTAETRRVSEQLAATLDAVRLDIRSAGMFQKELIRKKHPEFKNVKISRLYEQESSLGGDFFEVIRVRHNHVGIFMADVMGHGITSAFISLALKLKFEQYSRDNLATNEVIYRLNNVLIPLMPDSYFVAGFYGLVNLETLKMNFTQFGLPRPTLLRGKSLRVHPLLPMNMPLGFRKGALYRCGEATIHPGDRLLLFTDGCTEQKNIQGKFFGEHRFVELFKKLVREDDRNIVRKLYQEVVRFADRRPITDDIAILLCEFTDTK